MTSGSSQHSSVPSRRGTSPGRRRPSTVGPTRPCCKGVGMFRHVVLMRWKEDATAEQRSQVNAGLAELPSIVPTIRAYKFGDDARVNEGNFDLAIVADFDDLAGYLVYRD